MAVARQEDVTLTLCRQRSVQACVVVVYVVAAVASIARIYMVYGFEVRSAQSVVYVEDRLSSYHGLQHPLGYEARTRRGAARMHAHPSTCVLHTMSKPDSSISRFAKALESTLFWLTESPAERPP